MKLVALGANLPGPFGTPRQTLYAALTALARNNIWPVQVSRMWQTAPVPFDPAQDWYHNAVVEVRTDLEPWPLLQSLLAIEADFGRIRSGRNTPRSLDLDLIAYDDAVIHQGEDLIVPHPRMDTRAFVLLPLSDIADEWVHPASGHTLSQLISALPRDQQCVPIDGGWDE